MIKFIKLYIFCCLLIFQANSSSVAFVKEKIFFIDDEQNLCELNSNTLFVKKYENFPNNVHSLVASYSSLYILDNENNVYSMGDNTYGQLGLLDYQNREEPEKIADLLNISKIITADYSAYFIDFNGVVYAVGANNHGQLGLRDYHNKSQVTKIFNLPPIISIFSISCTSFFLSDEGNVYIAGHISARNNITNHAKRSNLSKIKNITCHAHIVFFIGNNNQIYFAAYQNFDEIKETNNQILYKSINIAYNYMIFLDINKDAYLQNMNQSCFDNFNLSNMKKMIDLNNISKIFNSEYHIYFLDTQGHVYICSSNIQNNIGLDFDKPYTVKKISNIPFIVNIYVCNKGALLIDESDKAWIIGFDKYKNPCLINIKVNFLNYFRNYKTKSANNHLSL